MDFAHISKPFRIFYCALKRFIAEKFTYRVSALTFSLLLAIVPYLLVSFFFFTHVPAMIEMTLLGRSYIVEHFIPSSATQIQLYFYGFIKQGSAIPTVNIIFLILSVTMMVETIEETLNDIWLVPNRSSFSVVFILNWLFFLLIPFIIGLSVFISSYFFSATWIVTATNWIGMTSVALSCIPLIINTIIFTLIYVLIPNVHVSWREGFSCGLLAAILFEFARLGFEWYVASFANYTLIYGIFAIFPIFLVWLYLFWFIIIFSALLVQESKQRGLLKRALV